MSNISAWSTTAASNNAAPPNGFPEGQSPSSLNDCARENMAAVSRFYKDTQGTLVSTGSANAYLLTTNNAHATLAAQSLIAFRANFTNTGAATIAVDGLAAKSIYSQGSAIPAGGIISGATYLLAYNSSADVYEVIGTTTSKLNSNLSANGKQIQWSKGADVASATALPVLTDGNYFDVTGTTAVTSINTTAVGNVIKLHFDGALTLTHHATDLILPGGANITTAAGDEAEFIEYATGDYRCTNYQKANGQALAAGSAGLALLSTVTASTSATVDLETTFDSTYDNYMIVASGVRPVANNASLRAQLKIGGSYIATSSYAYRADAGDSTADTLFVSRSIGDSSFNLANRGIGSGASDGCDVVMFVFEANSTTLKKRIKFSSDYSSSGTLSGDVGRGHNSGTAALTGVRFLMNSGNIATGTFRLYGIANS